MRGIPFVLFIISLSVEIHAQDSVGPGASRIEDILPMIEGRNVALVANQGSVVDGVHVVDTLLSSGFPAAQILRIFSPEHGFRGDHPAGEKIENQVDPKTGIHIVSLYGKNKKPSADQMAGLDLLIIDLQDVGVRFYTYISTLHYVMEACAENGIPLLVLDRPNPNGNYVDGPVLDTAYRSFVGMHPIPVVYGMTMGELACMINGEGWLSGGLHCEMEVIPCRGYSHESSYDLPVRPSPNLPNAHAIRLYPSTCFFEGTILSEGRGTPWPFEVFGHPDLPGDFAFVPESIPGAALHPKWEGETCRGKDLRRFKPQAGFVKLHLEFIIQSYKDFPDRDTFFIPFFDKLAGGTALREQIESGWTEAAIRNSWEAGLKAFSERRKLYLIYHE